MNKAVWSSILVAAMLLAVAGMAEAQQQEKIRRIGFLQSVLLFNIGSSPSVPPRTTRSRLFRGKKHRYRIPFGGRQGSSVCLSLPRNCFGYK